MFGDPGFVGGMTRTNTSCGREGFQQDQVSHLKAENALLEQKSQEMKKKLTSKTLEAQELEKKKIELG